MPPVRKLNAHLWDREPHEHYVEEQWCSRRLSEVEPIEGGVQLIAEVTVEREGQAKPACVAESVGRLYA